MTGVAVGLGSAARRTSVVQVKGNLVKSGYFGPEKMYSCHPFITADGP